jgi:hypothetical protein
MYNGVPLELEKKYVYKNEELEISACKFYISHLDLYQEDKYIYTVKNAHLFNLEDTATHSISIIDSLKGTYNKMSFYIGIDSLTHSMGALGGDLDPTTGMYWTWQSGYIYIKVEGKSSICQSRNHQFHLHIGGYQSPYNALQSVSYHVDATGCIMVYIDISTWLDEIDLRKEPEVMSPSKRAVEIAEKFAAAIQIGYEK